MAMRSTKQPEFEAAIGIAASGRDGLAYVAIHGGDRERLVRISFRMRPPAAGLDGRDVAYDALAAVASRLLDEGVRRIAFTLADERLPNDLERRQSLPAALNLPYVALRCRLNRFSSVRVESGETALVRDLTARARAEVSLHVAA